MFCQRHPTRPVKCGCMALCGECRAVHPTDCNCAKKEAERQRRLAETEQNQRLKRDSLHLELVNAVTERDKKRETEYQAKILELERKIEELKIDSQLELVQLERQYNAERMEHYDKLSAELARLQAVDVGGIARGKAPILPSQESEKVLSESHLEEKILENQPLEEEKVGAGEVQNLPSLAVLEEDPGAWLSGPPEQSMSVEPKTPAPSPRKKKCQRKQSKRPREKRRGIA
jgi:hypothetical protein